MNSGTLFQEFVDCTTITYTNELSEFLSLKGLASVASKSSVILKIVFLERLFSKYCVEHGATIA